MEQLTRRAVAGVFHGDDAARLKHDAGEQVQCLLRAVGDHDVAVAAFDLRENAICPAIALRSAGRPSGWL